MPLELTIQAILKLFLIGAAGFAAVRYGVLDDRAIGGLSRYVVYISLPCLILETLSQVLGPDLIGSLLLCLVVGAALIALGFLLAIFLQRLFLRGSPAGSRGLYFSLSSIHNSGYLPIPLVTALLPASQRGEALVYTFMHIFVMGLVFWSIGVRLISGAAADSRENLRRVVNPPIIALLLGFLFLVPAVKEAYGELTILRQALDLAGQSTIPLVLIILGGSLAAKRDEGPGQLRLILGSAVIRLLLVPAFALAAIHLLPFGKVFAFVLLLQSCMPAATNHIVVVREYGGDATLTSRALFVQYLAAIITVPIFLGLP